jgi:choline kinase
MPDLEKQVQAASPTLHAMWAMWGCTGTREDVENVVEEPEFDYIAYTQCRIVGFRQELKQLGPGLRIE